MRELTLLFCLLGAVAANSDVVSNLPGLSWKPNFKQYSGYLEATGTKHLHYWFVESANNPAKDPLVLWLNGGPGCSSMDGMLSEHGPFLVADDGLTLKKNPQSWNTVANMLYLEAPAGVGYSYSSDKQYKTSDKQVAIDNHAALTSFLKLYPQFRSNEFFITGESYGGIYVPTLSVLVAGDPAFNFKGFAVGNGLASSAMNDNSIIYFAYYHGLYGIKLWTTLVDNCCKDTRIDKCNFANSKDPICQNAVNEVMGLVSNLNIYNLYAECYRPSYGTNEANTTIINVPDLWLHADQPRPGHKGRFTDQNSGRLGQVKEVPPCINVTAITAYLNNKEVRQALHIPDDLPTWEICSGLVGVQYVRDYNNMTAQYLQLLAEDKYRLLVYNGDIDMACNFLGDEWFVDSLQQKLVKSWQPWYYTDKDGSKQVAGFMKQYKNLNFVTVKGAGHMVPSDKPIPALNMFTDFITNKM